MAIEDKAVKAFIEMSHHRLANPYHFADLIRTSNDIAASFLHKVAIGWFRLMEIEHRYGIGDPAVGEIGSRITYEVLADYDELPEYQPMRGFEDTGGDTSRTWESSKPSVPPSFIRKGAAT